MFGSIGTPEIIMILVIALIIFGPRKLPQIGKTLGKGLREFRKASQDMKTSIEKEIEMEDLKKELDSVKDLTDLTSDNKHDRK